MSDMSPAERLAVLETEVRQVRDDLHEMRASLKAIEKIASSGNGALRAVLIIGGAIGWLVGIALAVIAMFRQ